MVPAVSGFAGQKSILSRNNQRAREDAHPYRSRLARRHNMCRGTVNPNKETFGFRVGIEAAKERMDDEGGRLDIPGGADRL